MAADECTVEGAFAAFATESATGLGGIVEPDMDSLTLPAIHHIGGAITEPTCYCLCNMIQTKTGPTYRIVKDELSDGRGYRLTLVPEPMKEPAKPLLPLNPSDPSYLAVIAGITKQKLEGQDGPKEPLFVYATEEGIDLIREMGTTWVVDRLLSARLQDGEDLEERILAGAKACSLQRLPSSRESTVTTRLLRQETEVIDYLKRFGVTTRVADALQHISAQFTTFALQPVLGEYIAGKDFMLREYRMGSTLQTIREGVDDLTHDQDTGPFDMTKRRWLHWFEQFETEIAYISELFFIVGYEKGEPFTQADFSLHNWLCSGVDTKTLRPRLTLIDQRPNLLGTPDSVMDTDDMARSVRYRELMSRHRDDGTLALLRK